MINQRKAGALLSYVGLVVNGVVSFIYVPLLLGFLTQSEYGVYELIGSIISYLSVMDMGLSTTLSRFFVKEKASGTPQSAQNLLAMAAIVYAVITVLAVLVGIGIYFAIGPLFSGTFTSGELDLARQMMVLVIVNCAIVLPGNWFLALINANERFVFARSLSILKYVSQAIFVWMILIWQNNALNVLIVQISLNALAIAAYAVYCKMKLRIECRLVSWDWGLLRSLLSFSFFVLLNMVFDQVFWKTGQVVLGAVCGAAEVAIYGIVCKVITSAYMQISTGVANVFLPKLTQISALTEDMEEINCIFIKIGRLQAIMVWGVCALFIAVGRPFIDIWAGDDFSIAYPAIVVLMLGLSISLIQNLGISVLQAKNKQAFRATLYIIVAVLDVLISIPASKYFGVMGCAMTAALLLFICTGPIMNIYYKREIGLDVRSFFKEVIPLLVPSIISGCLSYFVCEVVLSGQPYLGLSFGILAFLFLYVALLWMRWLNAYEKGLVMVPLRALKRRLR